MIGRSGERGSGISVLPARHDDDDDDDLEQILEAASNKTAAIHPLTSHPTKHTRKVHKIFWVLMTK